MQQKAMAIYQDEERLYSEHSTAADVELLPCPLWSSRAILLYSGSWLEYQPDLSSGELAKTWNAEAEYCNNNIIREHLSCESCGTYHQASQYCQLMCPQERTRVPSRGGSDESGSWDATDAVTQASGVVWGPGSRLRAPQNARSAAWNGRSPAALCPGKATAVAAGA